MSDKPRYVDRRNPNDVYTIARVCDDMVWLKKEGGGNTLYESSRDEILSNFQSYNLEDKLEQE